MKQANVRIVSWNINEADPKNIRYWLTGHDHITNEPEKVLYVVGLLEIKHIADKKYTHTSWTREIQRILGSNFSKISDKTLAGTAVLVFARKNIRIKNVVARSHFQKLSTVDPKYVKGGVSVNLMLNSKRLCFILAHLEAHDHNLEVRNEQFRNVYKEAILPSKTSLDLLTSCVKKSKSSEPDFVFFFGDLNYRCDGIENVESRACMGGVEVCGKTKKFIVHEITKLVDSYDQLTHAMRGEEVIKYFQESEITFLPTFKYDVGTSTFDTSKKQRTPAWCDRILCKSVLPGKLEAKSYDSYHDYVISDHKPIGQNFMIYFE